MFIPRAHRFLDGDVDGDVGDDGLVLSDEVKKRLLELQEKGIDVNEMLLEMLNKRELEIQGEKKEIAESLEKTGSRHVPVKVRRVVEKEHGDKCSIHGCCKKAEVLHHGQPFALSKIHDPRFLAPLCKDHHAIAHSINVKVRLAKNRVKRN